MSRRPPDLIRAEYICALRYRDRYTIPEIMSSLGIGQSTVWDALEAEKGEFIRRQHRAAKRARMAMTG